MRKCFFHRWIYGGHIAEDMEVFCKICGKQSTVSAYSYAPLFFDGGIRAYKNPASFTKEDFKRLPRELFNNLADECTI